MDVSRRHFYSVRRTRGFLHVLFLIFAILGVSMWGISEILQKSVDAKQENRREGVTSLKEARQALINYALVPLSRIDVVANSGHYNFYRGDGERVPFRDFVLPCPDLLSDNNLDGLADIYPNGCAQEIVPGSAVADPLAATGFPLSSGARLGRLPWRDSVREDSSVYEYVRGVGNRDFRGSFNDRLWYALAGNVANADHAINPHALLRMTTGWLSVEEDGEVVSDRVAAVLIAPGAVGGVGSASRNSEVSLYSGVGAVPLSISLSNQHEAYLEESTYLRLTVDGVVSVSVSSDASDDKISYITVEDMVSPGGEGFALLTDESNTRGIYSRTGGENGFLGVQDMLEGYLNRHGYLPEPSVFDEVTAESRFRAAGVPRRGIVLTNTIVASATETTVTVDAGLQVADIREGQGVTIEMLAQNLPPVYLLPSNISLSIDVSPPLIAPPFNVVLADMDTALSYTPLLPAQRDALEAAGHYPHLGSLFGVADLAQGVPGVGNVIPQADYSNVQDFSLPVNSVTPSGGILFAALAEPAWGYVVDSVLVSVVAFNNQTVTMTPPQGVNVLLPAGTQVAVDALEVELELPEDFSFNGQYDANTGNWNIADVSEKPVILRPRSGGVLVSVDVRSNFFITSAVPAGTPVAAGNDGFLPINNEPNVEYLDTILTLTLAEGGVSQLAMDMTLYPSQDLVLQPFPPPGLPVEANMPAAPFAIPTPLAIRSETEFFLPSASKIIYPVNAVIDIGLDFVFPDDAVALMPIGAVMRVDIPANAVLPSGESVSSAVPDALITLHNGGFVRFVGVRPVLARGAAFSDKQALFDIELRGNVLAHVASTGDNISYPANALLQPFSGKFLDPSRIELEENMVLLSQTRTRAGFLARAAEGIVYGGSSAAGATAASFDSLQTNITLGVNLLAGLSSIQILPSYSVTVDLSEDTHFMLPDVTRITLGVAPAQEFILPEETIVYDHGISGIYNLSVASGEIAVPVLSSPFVLDLNRNNTVGEAATTIHGAFQRHFALFPDADMYVQMTSGAYMTIHAGSIVDLLNNVVHGPYGVQRVQRVSEDAKVVSGSPMHIYLAEEATLRIAPSLPVSSNNILSQAPVSVSVHYVSYSNFAAAAVGNIVISNFIVANPADNLNLPSTLVDLPSGTFIVIPPGSKIDFLSDDLNRNPATGAEYHDRDSAVLPANAVAVIPSGKTAVVGGNNAVGPALLRLGGNNGSFAFVNREQMLGDLSPMVFMSGSGNLVKDDGESLLAEVPAFARLDLFGEMAVRAERSFVAGMLPVASSELVRDFPMVYAVAAECRKYSSAGVDCAQGDNEGLVFDVPEGESIILEEDIVAPGAVLLTVDSPGVFITVDETSLIDGAGAAYSLNAIIICVDGSVMGYQNGLATPINFGRHSDSELVVSAVAGTRNTVIRAYFADAVSRLSADTNQLSYVDIDGALTVHPGGYVGDRYDDAYGVSISINTNMTLGLGAQLVGARGGEKVFGVDSSTQGYVGVGRSDLVAVSLNNFVLANKSAANYAVAAGLGADVQNIDFLGGTQFYSNVGNTLTLTAPSSQPFSSETPVIEVDPINTNLIMNMGYLWQGYVPAGGVNMAFSRNTNIMNIYTSPDGRTYPEPNIELRIHPTVTALNFWGSGLERAEGMDGESAFGGLQQILGNAAAPNIINVNIDFRTGTPNIYQEGFVTQLFADLGLPVTSNVTNAISVSIRVRNLDTGEIEATIAMWRPQVTLTTAPSTSTPYQGGIRWNDRNHPFAGFSDPAYGAKTDSEDMWVVSRRVVDTNAQENSFIDGFDSSLAGCASSTAATQQMVAFNLPPVPIIADDVPIQTSWNLQDFRARLDAYENRLTATLTLRLATPAVDGAGAGGIFILTTRSHAVSTPVSLTVASDYLNVPSTLSSMINVNTNVTTSYDSDLLFFMDRRYNTDNVPGLVQTLSWGNDFNIEGVGAIVPPFGAASRQAVADLYAQRSKLMTDIFGYDELRDIYTSQTGDCSGTGDCPEMYNSPDWIPVVGGIIAFDAVNLSLSGAAAEDVYFVYPEPQGEVVDVNGSVITIYAGSIIFPLRNLIIPAAEIPVSTQLHIPGGALAGIDVSPASAPSPIRVYRDDTYIRDWDFNYAPATLTVGNCVVEVVNFPEERIADLRFVTPTIYVDVSIKATVVEVTATVNAVSRYDGTFARGILLDADGERLAREYYSGVRDVFDAGNNYGVATGLSGADPFPTGFIKPSVDSNFDLELGNPLSYRWSTAGSHFLRMGVSRANVTDPFEPVGVALDTDGNEFEALRIAHKIDISPMNSLPLRQHSQWAPYPNTGLGMFQFPVNSQATVLNLDATSWESIHPYVALHGVGLSVTLSNSTLVVTPQNDGYRTLNVGERYVLPFSRSETAPAEDPYSTASAYTNAWLRLHEGASLEDQFGKLTSLPKDTIVNPVMGTYFGGAFFEQLNVTSVLAQYRTSAELLDITGIGITVVRPALIIPAGSRLHVGSETTNTTTKYVRYANVQAAAFFSLTPLDAINCAAGDIDLVDGMDAINDVQISQTREGVSENNYETATGIAFGLGHPCAWLDERENVDGDRFYIYRGRRRYVNDIVGSRVVSNDRTYLVGGKLEFQL
jgi:hypothetical protein